MNNESLFSSSKKFRHILNQLTKDKVLRIELISIAIAEFRITKKQATGLIDRGVYQLKQQGFVTTSGKSKNIYYQFCFNAIEDQQYQLINGYELTLYSEKEILEKELMQTRYELEAYQEFLAKMPQQKLKIVKLQQDCVEKLNQLGGKLRAIKQMLPL